MDLVRDQKFKTIIFPAMLVFFEHFNNAAYEGKTSWDVWEFKANRKCP